MKIFGIGTDIANISRIKKSLKNEKLVARLYHKSEIQKCKKHHKQENCFAKRFAAKEAFSKALGTGIARGIKFNEIVVHNVKSGKPKIKIFGNTRLIVKKIFKKKKINIFLSLSDEKPFAVATVVISL